MCDKVCAFIGSLSNFSPKMGEIILIASKIIHTNSMKTNKYWAGNAVYLCLAGQVYVGVGIESKQSSSYVGKHSAVT